MDFSRPFRIATMAASLVNELMGKQGRHPGWKEGAD